MTSSISMYFSSVSFFSSDMFVYLKIVNEMVCIFGSSISSFGNIIEDSMEMTEKFFVQICDQNEVPVQQAAVIPQGKKTPRFYLS